ncbi:MULTISPECIES: hypothetical protein [unclassified Pseudodesulfovibrio]|uniref:hypothetical protein n=1 Tax=unclassified Pseudodesulfovibrio TaxID=2661612 RepID=UPI000FEB8ED1|nr:MULTISPECIES: hypothetical protein [unclassified Pseudodesulfovibrio]MCJ2164689.1 hypothetical protein [Pseudodesulfovibrio sp. S3-i]RWU04120.1 hypothetical protein DWB63_08930 [Pseudodesulfovibrio sp. S3]
MAETSAGAAPKQGFSWMGLLFGGMYFAGYGKLVKGLIMGALSFIPLTAIAVHIYAGIKARKELPVGEQAFSWMNAIIVFCVTSAITGAVLYIVQGA